MCVCVKNTKQTGKQTSPSTTRVPVMEFWEGKFPDKARETNCVSTKPQQQWRTGFWARAQLSVLFRARGEFCFYFCPSATPITWSRSRIQGCQISPNLYSQLTLCNFFFFFYRSPKVLLSKINCIFIYLHCPSWNGRLWEDSKQNYDCGVSSGSIYKRIVHTAK